jgi:hypothetical protein
MSDEIVDVSAEYVLEITNKDVPEEKITKDGMNIPDPAFIDETTEEGIEQIKERREEVANLPQFPNEWQQDYRDEDTKGFDDNLKIPVTATIKQDEITKLIKKYKRYMKSNLREIRRVETETENYDG